MNIEVYENSFILLISEELCTAKKFAEKFFPEKRIFFLEHSIDDTLSYINQRLATNQFNIVSILPRTDLLQLLLQLAKDNYLKPISFIFRFDESCHTPSTLKQPQLIFSDIKAIKRTCKNFGYTFTYVFNSEKEAHKVNTIHIKTISVNKSSDHGPFDIIGDIHGCYDELCELLTKLGYIFINQTDNNSELKVEHPGKRKVIFLGDIVDRGPKIPEVLRLVMSMVNDGNAYCISGNHDEKLLRFLKGRKVKIRYGLESSIEQLQNEDKTFHTEVIKFLDALPFHLVLDNGELVVTHAGIKERMIGKISDEIKEFCLYGGDPNGDRPELNDKTSKWNEDYHGSSLIVYGHSTVKNPDYKNNTIDLDTGCVIGEKLSAMKYPEMQIVSVACHYNYTQHEELKK